MDKMYMPLERMVLEKEFKPMYESMTPQRTYRKEIGGGGGGSGS